MIHKSRKYKTTYGIVGLGKFGYALAKELGESGCELIVLDENEDKLREIREITENAYVVTHIDKKTLMDTGIQNCEVAVVCIGEHMDTSILTTLNLISMRIPLVISKATSAEHGLILEKLGAEVVYPERDMAVRLAGRLETTRMLDFVQLSEKINVSKTEVPIKAIGKTVLEMKLRHEFGLNIIAVENDGTVIETVNPDYVFREKDILFLCGSKQGLQDFDEWSNQ